MSLTNVDYFNRRDCDKIDAKCVNAYVDFHLDPENPTGICLDTSWGGDCLDLTDIVKEAETCTSLYLSPVDDPNCLVYEGECENFCITGDELSRIISMHLLKDVDQETAPQGGDVYMFNRDTNLFEPFNLQQYIDNMGVDLTAIWAAINNLRGRVTTIENQIAPIINRWQIPEGVPDNAKILLGNINIYSDVNAAISGAGAVTSLDKTHGVYGHSLNTDLLDDEIFG